MADFGRRLLTLVGAVVFTVGFYLLLFPMSGGALWWSQAVSGDGGGPVDPAVVWGMVVGGMVAVALGVRRRG